MRGQEEGLKLNRTPKKEYKGGKKILRTENSKIIDIILNIISSKIVSKPSRMSYLATFS